MQNGAILLDAAVVSSTNNFVVKNQHRADRDSSFGKSLTSFLDRSLKKLIHDSTQEGCEFKSAAVK